jgi:formylglycine-generating enzyme required for sulfatase activity
MLESRIRGSEDARELVLPPSFFGHLVPAVSLAFGCTAGMIAACGGGVARQGAGSGEGGSGDAAGARPDAGEAGPADADDADIAVGPPPCPSTCGPSADESCCMSLPVDGGTFYRSYDGVTCEMLGQTCYTAELYPATVSDFRLDRFEVTVGRYRPFVDAVENGWHPAPGAGKHAHLNGGQGVVDRSVDAGAAYETGWDPSWNALLDQTEAFQDAGVCASQAEYDYTASPGPHDNLPVSCVSWWAAYAFCIWDGGFLPTEAEWNYASSGGSQQRIYPWGAQAIDCTHANFDWCLVGDAGIVWENDYESVVGSYSPRGDGLFGQSDLEGNVSEWTLDWWSSYVTPCVDCAYLHVDSSYGTQRVTRGASFDQSEPYILPVVSERGARPPDSPLSTGIRCARTP